MKNLKNIQHILRSNNPLLEGIFYFIATGNLLYTGYKLLGFSDGNHTTLHLFWKGPGYSILFTINTILLILMVYQTVKGKSLKYIRVWYILFWFFIIVMQCVTKNILENGQGG
jgi:hypothetical protein